PLKQLTFGGLMRGSNMVPAGVRAGEYVNTPFQAWQLQSKSAQRSHKIEVFLHIAQVADVAAWQNGLNRIVKEAKSAERTAFRKSQEWWKQCWQRSYVMINPDQPDAGADPWQVGRNYQLFRYQLACNAYGAYPTKFNGGLFTVDPVF